MKLPRSKTGLFLALLYSIVTIVIIYTERVAPTYGNFISLPGMGTFLATLPASLALAKTFPSLRTDSGHLVTDQMSLTILFTYALLIISCAFLVYLLGVLLGILGKLIKRIFSKKK
jgi:hypothetical protein